MNEIIAISSRNVGGETVQTVNARDLHAFLEAKTAFKDWIARRIEDFGFIEGTDFCSFLSESGGRPSKEYALTLSMGKELSMVERNAQGKKARAYFIACEHQVKTNLPALPRTYSEALRKLADVEELKEKLLIENAAMQPKADFFDAVTDTTVAVDMGIVAKTLNMGIGRNTLFEFLREKEILDKRNIPYQKYCDRGYFRVVESQFNKPDGTACINFKTVVFQKGMDFIRRSYAEAGTAAVA